jgi:hypothetical protein
MQCGFAHTPMSLSSTTTSDPRRSPKPPDSRVDPGVFALLEEARSGRIPQGFRRRSAPDAAWCRSGSQLNHDLGGDAEFAWADLADSIEDHTIVRERHLMRLPASELVAPDLAEDFANLGRVSSRPRACRVTRAAPPETSTPLPQTGVVVRVHGITQVRAEVDPHAEQVVAVARRPGRTYGVRSVRSRHRASSFQLAPLVRRG